MHFAIHMNILIIFRVYNSTMYSVYYMCDASQLEQEYPNQLIIRWKCSVLSQDRSPAQEKEQLKKLLQRSIRNNFKTGSASNTTIKLNGSMKRD